MEKYITSKQSQLDTYKSFVLANFNEYSQEQREEIVHDIDALQERIDFMKEFFEDMENIHEWNKTTEEV